MIDPSTIKVGDLIEYKFNFMEDVQKHKTGRVTKINQFKSWESKQVSFSLDNDDRRVGADEVVKIIN